MNWGAGFGPGIPLDYVFYREYIVTTWFKTALEKLDNSLNVKVEKYVK